MPTNALHDALQQRWGVHFKWHAKVLGIVESHPEYARQPDDHGYYPAHLVCAFGGTRDVATRILELYPEAATLANKAIPAPSIAACPSESDPAHSAQGGWLPLHLACCWNNLVAGEVFFRAFPEACYYRDAVRATPVPPPLPPHSWCSVAPILRHRLPRTWQERRRPIDHARESGARELEVLLETAEEEYQARRARGEEADDAADGALEATEPTHPLDMLGAQLVRAYLTPRDSRRAPAPRRPSLPVSSSHRPTSHAALTRRSWRGLIRAT